MKKIRDWIVKQIIGLIKSITTWYTETINKNEKEYLDKLNSATKYVFDTDIHNLIRDACKSGDLCSAIKYAESIAGEADTFLQSASNPFDLEANTSFFNHLKFFVRLTESVKDDTSEGAINALLEEYEYFLQNFRDMIMRQSELKLRITNTENNIHFWALVYNPIMT